MAKVVSEFYKDDERIKFNASEIVAKQGNKTTTIKDHLEEASGKHIHSSGITWKRFDDGSAEIYMKVEVSDSVGGQGLVLYNASDASYPIPFIEPPVLIPIYDRGASNISASAGYINTTIWVNTKNTFNIRLYDPMNEGFEAGDVGIVNLIAKGRWKETP